MEARKSSRTASNGHDNSSLCCFRMDTAAMEHLKATSRTHDIVIFGASGFTGKYILEMVKKICCSENNRLKVAVAGRSRKKLEDVLDWCSKREGIILNNIPIVVADINDHESLRNMAKTTKLVVNCCGPYVLLGEQVVKACIEEGTHLIDVAAEPLFTERLHLNYQRSAKEKGVYVVSTCGLDYVLSDMGVLFLEENFPGKLNSVEIYFHPIFKHSGVREPSLTYTSWYSLVYNISNIYKCFKLYAQTRPKSLPDCQPRLKMRLLQPPTPIVQKPAIPYLYPNWDTQTIEKTQAYLYETEAKRPIQTHSYLVISSYLVGFVLMIFGFIWLVLSQFKLTRKLLIKNPKLFTSGYITGEDPTEDNFKSVHYSYTFFGRGWKDSLSNDESKTPSPNYNTVGKISGHNPYDDTCLIAAICAKVLITETNKLPKTGGVYTPGAAFLKTSLIKQLNEHGVTFEIINDCKTNRLKY